MSSSIGVIPAYGRDYGSVEAITKDWLAGKDFMIADVSCQWNGSYVNRGDAETYGIAEVRVRYAKKTKQTTLDTKTGKVK